MFLFLDLTIFEISGDLGNLVVNVFQMYQPEHFTVTPVDKNAWNRNNYSLNLSV